MCINNFEKQEIKVNKPVYYLINLFMAQLLIMSDEHVTNLSC